MKIFPPLPILLSVIIFELSVNALTYYYYYIILFCTNA